MSAQAHSPDDFIGRDNGADQTYPPRVGISYYEAKLVVVLIEFLKRKHAESVQQDAADLQLRLLAEIEHPKDETPASGSVKPSAALDMPPLKHRIGVRAAAKILNIKEDSVRHLVEKGRLDSVKEGREHRISMESVQAHKARQISRACR